MLACLQACLPAPCMLECLHSCLPAYLPACMLACQHACLPACLPACVPACALHACLPSVGFNKFDVFKKRKSTEPVLGAKFNSKTHSLNTFFNCFEPFHARSASKIAKSATMTFKHFFQINTKVAKTQNLCLFQMCTFYNFFNGFELRRKISLF
jgi:hypothetical protein